jgi:biopolymer transport protein ExbD
MAEIIQEEKAGGKRKAKKHAPHIDMTPMVDLMCLLITFFMLTSALNKPKIMEIVLPEKQTDPNAAPPKIAAARTMNILLGPDNKIYWYTGNVKPEEYNSLPPVNETDFSPSGIRMLLLERNRALFKKIDNYKNLVITGKLVITQDSLNGSIRQLKKDDDTGPIVLIKAYKKANYGNVVDIFDEMNICGVAHYMLVDITWYEEKMVETAAGIPSTAVIAKK